MRFFCDCCFGSFRGWLLFVQYEACLFELSLPCRVVMNRPSRWWCRVSLLLSAVPPTCPAGLVLLEHGLQCLKRHLWPLILVDGVRNTLFACLLRNFFSLARTYALLLVKTNIVGPAKCQVHSHNFAPGTIVLYGAPRNSHTTN